MNKRILALLLALTLMLGMAVNVSATETEPQVIAEGTIEMVSWKLYDDGNLLIEGNLIVSEYAVPWRNYMDQITKVSLVGTRFSTKLLNNLPNLTTVYFPRSAAQVLSSFSNCPKFTAFTAAQDGEDFLCRNGYLLDNGGLRLCRAPTGLSGKVVLPDYLTIIEDYAFFDCDYIEELVLSEGLKSVGIRSFVDCNALKTVVFPSTLNRVAGHIFEYCDNLESIYFTGDAPTAGMEAVNNGGPVFGDYSENRIPKDNRVTANVYYPADNETWTEEVREAFGGSVTWIPYNPDNPFRDVPLDAFYEEPVLWAVENGITNGTSDTTFSPDTVCNRAQVVTFLWRAAGCPEPAVTENPFVDVEQGSFYEKAVLWAVEKGITNGMDDTHFEPDGVCNRSQVVTFLYRAFGQPTVGNVANPFTDVPTNKWYATPVLWAVKEGITNGMSENSFAPENTCTRAQVVTFLYRAYVN